jgi:hypothetical protein
MAASRSLLSGPRFLLPVVLVLAGGIVSADVSSSEAAGQHTGAAACTLTVPSKVYISAPHQLPTFKLGVDCAAAGFVRTTMTTRAVVGNGTTRPMGCLRFGGRTSRDELGTASQCDERGGRADVDLRWRRADADSAGA